jgi:hypothetical protein
MQGAMNLRWRDESLIPLMEELVYGSIMNIVRAVGESHVFTCEVEYQSEKCHFSSSRCPYETRIHAITFWPINSEYVLRKKMLTLSEDLDPVYWLAYQCCSNTCGKACN